MFAWAIEKEEIQAGLDFLDEVRRETDVPNLEPDRIRGYISSLRKTEVKIIVSESLARKAGDLFLNRHTVQVEVPEGSLSDYVYIHKVVEKDPETGEIFRVYGEWRVNEKDVLAAWEDNNFPTRWGL